MSQSARRDRLVYIERVDHVVARVGGANGVVDADQKQSGLGATFGYVDTIQCYSGLVIQDRVLDEAAHGDHDLVVALGGTAALLMMLGAAFVGWTVVLVYIGAVIILFLIGIMITRAPLGVESELSHPRGVLVPVALLSVVLFGVISYAVIDTFSNIMIEPFEPTATGDLANQMFSRWVIPFEVVSFVLLAALVVISTGVEDVEQLGVPVDVGRKLLACYDELGKE